MKISARLLLILLAVVGAFTGIAYMILDSETENVTFTYQRATEREDGTPLSPGEIRYTRVYCDGKLVSQEDGADGDISAELTGGSHVCYGTHVDTNNLESNPSKPVTRFVEL